MKIVILLFGFFSVFDLQSQNVKQEFEQRIQADRMPVKALSYLKTLTDKKNHLRHYFEQDGEQQSFESKFRLNGARFSVEFDENGNLEDIEIEFSKKEMGIALNQVTRYLKQTYKRHKIEKIQAQYQSKKEFNSLNPGRPDAWELIVATKDAENKMQRYEMTFDAEGNPLKSRKVLRRSYAFLLF